MIQANATGCSSIYGGNLPTTPWSHRHAGRGPAWNNSLFEDNAEFGMGMRVSPSTSCNWRAFDLPRAAEERLARHRQAISSRIS